MTLIAVDGPGGAGKSTLARRLAEHLHLEMLDTGAMYRAVSLAALRLGISPDDGEELGELARRIVLDVGPPVRFGEEDVSSDIRSDEVNAIVSQVASHRAVREALVERQRAWVDARGGNGVVEGRDIASVVCPDASLKIYLTASPIERAARRTAELAEHYGGELADLASVTAMIAQRDLRDATRDASPLVVTDGAIVVDSTGRSSDEVLREVLELLEKADEAREL